MCDPSSKVILVHLSDIHFVKASTVGPDVLDEDVRRELKRDVIALCGTLGSAHGILVTGDIAYSGKSEEYKRAEDWLLELCRETKCDEQNVWMICGSFGSINPTDSVRCGSVPNGVGASRRSRSASSLSFIPRSLRSGTTLARRGMALPSSIIKR